MNSGQQGEGRRSWFARSAAAGALGVALASSAAGQSAYFSFEGVFDAATDRHNFNFDLTRDVPSGEDLRFRTLADQGGVNAAGDTVPLGGIDSVLALTNDAMSINLTNDDVGGSLDSLIDPAVTLPADAYRLNMSNLTNTAGLTWAVDVVGPADALVFTAAAPDTTSVPGTSTTNSLKFGTTGVGTAAATFNQTGTLTIGDELVVAQTGNAVFTNTDTGSTHVNGTTTVSFGGTLNAIGTTGVFNANGGVDVDGGVLHGKATRFTVGAGQTVQVLNGGEANLDSFTISAGVSVIVETDSTLNATEYLDIFNGTLDVADGSVFTIDHSDDNLSLWGFGGGNATITLRTQATGDFDELVQIGTGGTLNVQSGAQITLDNFEVGAGGGIDTGVVNLTGFEPAVSKITQRGTSTLMVGTTATGAGALHVSDGAEYNSAAGAISVESNGTVAVFDEGTFNANGVINLNGGAVDVIDFGIFNANQQVNVNASGTVKVLDEGVFTANDAVVVNGGGSLLVNFDPNPDVGLPGFQSGNTAFFNANDHVTLEGGTVRAIGAEFNVAAGKDITANNEGVLDFDGDYFIEGGSTITINGESTFTVSRFMNIGTNADGGGDGTLIVDGVGSTATIDPADDSGFTSWGGGGDNADVTARNGGAITVGSGDLELVSSDFTGPDAGSVATVDVLSGGSLTANSILVATGDEGVARLNVVGFNSAVTQLGASPLEIGGATNSVGEVRVSNAARYHAGSGGVTVNPTGTLTVTGGGAFLGADAAVGNDGVVRGNGTIVTDSFTNRATLKLASTADPFDNTLADDLTITGDFTQTAAGTLEVGRVAGADLVDALNLDGNTILGGALAFVADDPAAAFGTLTMYNTMDVVRSASTTGVFDSIIGHVLGDDTALAVTYAIGGVVATRALYGDANLDGFISQGDLDAVLLNWGNTALANGSTWSTGDLSGDGAVGQADLDAVLLNWGNGTPPTPLTAVPEPASVIFLALGGAGVLLRRRH